MLRDHPVPPAVGARSRWAIRGWVRFVRRKPEKISQLIAIAGVSLAFTLLDASQCVDAYG